MSFIIEFLIMNGRRKREFITINDGKYKKIIDHQKEKMFKTYNLLKYRYSQCHFPYHTIACKPR